MPDAASIAREMVDALNSGDMTRYRGLLHLEYTYTGGDAQTQRGPDAGVAVAQMYLGAFSDMKMDIQHLHAAGNTVILEFVGRGKHSGDLMGIAPTGRKIAQPVVSVLETRDGKIYAEREYFDSAYMMQQLGVAPVPATA